MQAQPTQVDLTAHRAVPQGQGGGKYLSLQALGNGGQSIQNKEGGGRGRKRDGEGAGGKMKE